MKKSAWLLLLAPIFAFKCEKENEGWIEGKVIRISCASFIIQVQNHDDLGEDGWKDIFDNDKQYDNAFNARNMCEVPEAAKKGTVLRFRIKSASQPTPCAACYMYDAPPQVSYEITDISVKKP